MPQRYLMPQKEHKALKDELGQYCIGLYRWVHLRYFKKSTMASTVLSRVHLVENNPILGKNLT